ncbi:hypothetical protein O181_008281 [Austropuccinia psidii MF-1]|uniref:Chromo domain-containing protein n=1 Tax=Austropuccinia psidii MF-1 TaxID=1389203 RepID=A0A9Q3GID2_9BASI|nr:hypothetical protein [Austropuccinia psidii MF-1]
MEEMLNLTQLTLLKTLLLERYQQKVQSLEQDVKRGLEVSLNRLKRYADKIREGPPAFNPGDMIVGSFSNIEESQYSLIPPQAPISPYQWKFIQPVYHVSLLEPVKTSTIPNKHQEPPPPILIEEDEWEFSQILDSKIKRGNPLYLVEWKVFGTDPEKCT